MPEPSTGKKRVDKDLSDLLSALEKASDLRQSLEADTLSQEEFEKALPDGPFKLAKALTIPSNFELILQQTDSVSHDQIRAARDRVQNEILTVLESELGQTRLKTMLNAQESGLKKALRTISGMSGIHAWYGSPERLVPSVRIGFISSSDELLFESTFDWDDLFYVTEGMVKILTESLEISTEFGESKRIHLGDEMKKKLAGRLRTIRDQSEKAFQLAKVYGILIDEEPADTKSD